MIQSIVTKAHSLVKGIRVRAENKKQQIKERHDFIDGLCRDVSRIPNDHINQKEIDILSKLTTLTLPDLRQIEIKTRSLIIPGPIPVFTEVHEGTYKTPFGIDRLTSNECSVIISSVPDKLSQSKYP
jgi:hypothetical protein